MTHLLCTTALICALPGLAAAQDAVLRADISQAVVHAQGAEVTRQVRVALSAGDSDLFIAMPDVAWATLVQVTGPDGVAFGPASRRDDMALDAGALDSDAQAAARDAVDAAKQALLATQDEVAAAEADIRAIEAQLAYLNALTQGEGGVAMPQDPALVSQFLATLGAETRRVVEELSATRAVRRELSDRVEARRQAVEAADAALAQLRPFGETVPGIRVTATAEAAMDAVLSVTYLSDGVYWTPSYDMRLDSASGALDIARHVTLSVDTPARWDTVDVMFSTANPSRQRQPQDVWSRPARILDDRDPPRAGLMPRDAVMAEAMVEPVMIQTEDRAAIVIDGLSVRYDYATPISIGAAGSVTVPLDNLSLDMETEARAAPRFDQTAFLLAMGENESGETVLPGEARFYRDGALVGEDWINLTPAGAEMELAFGALDHLRLVWIDRSNAEGDRGIFTTSNTQARNLAFGVENTGPTPETVRVLYAVPFSEQEDLEMGLRLSPMPDETDFEDRRGVHAWQIEVAPGATELVEMQVEFSWPEGQILDWRP